MTLKEPQDYDSALKHWSLESLPYVPERFGLKPVAEKRAGKQLAVIRRLFRTADELIAATHSGREGELIVRRCKPHMPSRVNWTPATLTPGSRL